MLALGTENKYNSKHLRYSFIEFLYRTFQQMHYFNPQTKSQTLTFTSKQALYIPNRKKTRKTTFSTGRKAQAETIAPTNNKKIETRRTEADAKKAIDETTLRRHGRR